MSTESKTKSKQELKFSPEALSALGSELLFQLGQLNPIQREQVIRAAQLTTGQPGATGAPRAIPQGLFRPVAAATRQAAPGLDLSTTQLGPILDTLRSGTTSAQGAARRQGGEVVRGISSFVDPRFANILSPIPVSSSSTSQSDFQTAMQIASLVVGIGGAVT